MRLGGGSRRHGGRPETSTSRLSELRAPLSAGAYGHQAGIPQLVLGGGEIAHDYNIGSLVCWPTAPDAPLGIVVDLDSPRISVLFDGEDQSKTFNARAGAVVPVELSGMVRRVSTGAIGLLQARTTTTPPRWQVIFDSRLVVVAESDLRPHVLDDPRSRLLGGRLGSARQFALAVTARRYELEQLSNELVSLGESRVALKPHQVSVVHRVVTNYPHRFLLCDEVGLGKTIEAGMILKELRARGGATRALVIVPPNLVRQWQFELKSKFNETFSIINSATVKHLRDAQGIDGNPFAAFDSVLVSSAWISSGNWAELASQVDWDLVIVDEAHHARVSRSGTRRQETQLYKAVRELVSPDAFSKRAALFLTATPMQLDSRELYSLVELLDPALFPTEEDFDEHRRAVPGLSRLVHELTHQGFPVVGESDEAVVRRVAAWLGLDEADAVARLRAGPSSIAGLCDELSERHRLSAVLVRNRKKIVGGFMPRRAHRWEVELSLEERQALAAVEAYVLEGFARAARTNSAAVGFVMVIFQKLMASSIRALRASLEKRRQRLLAAAGAPTLNKRTLAMLDSEGDRLDDEEYVSGLLADIAVADNEEAVELGVLVELLAAVPKDSKAETLVARLTELRQLDPQAKVLLFTEFRETQDYLRERLETIGWNVQLFHGQLKPEAKDASVEAFRTSPEASILLSTEAGGEGRNFQFCHLLVNYDLPWNPMRVEQRIGRVDRIGQTDTVQVFNFWIAGTIEERVLNVLERRINIFEETVGGLDPILGEAEKDLKKVLQLGGEERDRALEHFETQLEQRLHKAREAEERLRDFIMETKSYSKEIAAQLTDAVSPISHADQELFVSRLLADVNTYLDRQPDGTFHITFHEPFVSDYPKHTKDGLRRRTVALRPDVKPDSQDVEYLALGNPVVDDLVARVTSSQYAGATSAFEVDDEELSTTSGWLVVHELGVPALKDVRELTACFIHDSGNMDADLGCTLMERFGRFPNDRALAPADVQADEVLEAALGTAEARAFARLDELEARAQAESARIREREIAKLSGYFDYRDNAARDRLASSREVLARLLQREDADGRRVIPVWKANVARDERLIEELLEERTAQLAQLERRAVGRGDSRLVAVARIEISGGDAG